MSEEMIPFQFESHNVRVQLDAHGEPWWIAADVCAILGLKDVSRSVARLEPNEKGTLQSSTLGGQQEMLTVNESGLYRLIFRSDKPEAKRFQSWVFSEVLPSIRKTGRYEVPAPLPPLPLPQTVHERISDLRLIRDFLEELGGIEERDLLMIRDQVRSAYLLPSGPSSPAQPALTTRAGFQAMERVTRLGYRLTRKQAAALAGPLGKKLKAEHLTRYGEVPPTADRFVDGAIRPVCWYRPEDADWIDPIVQAFFAGFPGVERTPDHA